MKQMNKYVMMIYLFMLHGGKFIFIRFNPYKFKDKNGKTINPTL
jgi:hypothetical protein